MIFFRSKYHSTKPTNLGCPLKCLATISRSILLKEFSLVYSIPKLGDVSATCGETKLAVRLECESDNTPYFVITAPNATEPKTISITFTYRFNGKYLGMVWY